MRKDIFEAVFMETKNDEKINYSSVARQYNCDPRTVKRYFETRAENPTIRKPRVVKRKLDGFENIIEDKFLNHHAPATGIFNVLKQKYGYLGSYSNVKRYVHSLKEKEIQAATIRYETSPGYQCQIDWKESLKLYTRDNKPVVINVFLSILGYSRLKYIELTEDKTQATLFRCLTNAIKYFGGTPKEFLFDNMRTVVDRSRTQYGKPIYNDMFVAFTKDAGFTPRSCLAYRPRTKGKIEVVAKIMNRLKAFNNEFDSIEDLNNIVKDLMKTINQETSQTTKEKPVDRFKKETEYLNKEPNYEILEAYFSKKPITRKVPKDALIVFQNKSYSVPPKYIGKIVTIEFDGHNLNIYYNKILICVHTTQNKIINYLPEHYKEIVSSSISDSTMIESICTNNLNLFDKL